MVKCESLRMNMYRITHTGKSMNFPVTCLMGRPGGEWGQIFCIITQDTRKVEL